MCGQSYAFRNLLLLSLPQQHHFPLQIKRFAETFFVHETSASQLLSIYETKYAAPSFCLSPDLRKQACLARCSVTGHEGLAQLVRTSRYFNGLPPLPIECPELDGDPTTMPIIFEDIYLPEVSDRRDSGKHFSRVFEMKLNSL